MIHSASKLGFVIGTKMQRTIKVRVEVIKIHPIVKKHVRYHKTIFAHDDKEVCVLGDFVRIDGCPKKSKNKKYELGEIVRPAKRILDPFGNLHTEPVRMPEKDLPAQFDMDKFK